MTTIKDVAAKAGVTKSTVSYYLNNTKSLKKDTTNRIKEAIEELNYSPRMVARSLKTKQTLTIGVIVPDISISFFTDIIKGIEDVAFSQDFSIILCNTREDEKKEKKYLKTLISKDIDGLIFISTGRNKHILDNVENVPIVVVDRKMGDSVRTVIVDNVMGGHMATKYLIEKRGVPIHFLTGRLGISTYFDRLSGYIKAHNDFGYEYNETMVLESDISIEGAMSTIYKLLDTNVYVRSIFATSDILALGALKALTQRGFTVGKDILLIGYDDSQMDQIVTPSLTTIRQPKYEMGVEAAKMLIDQIKGNKGECERITMIPDIIIRETA